MHVLVLLAVIGVACGSSLQASRIVGGASANIEDHPYMASLEHNYYGISFTHHCGGAVVSSRAILSAAHCYADRNTAAWRVRVGSSISLSGGSEYEVSSFIVHPDFNDYLLINDVAVVRLSYDVVFSNKVGMALIAGSNFNTPDNTSLSAAGWGATEILGDNSISLQQVELQAINHEICTQRYADLNAPPDEGLWPDVTAEMMCTGILDVGGKGPCDGDAGGPIIQGNNVVVGIISWGFECGDYIYPSVNVRVSSYSSWIFNAAS